MPPKWALGYHQCRWSYDSADRVLEVGRNVAFICTEICLLRDNWSQRLILKTRSSMIMCRTSISISAQLLLYIKQMFMPFPFLTMEKAICIRFVVRIQFIPDPIRNSSAIDLFLFCKLLLQVSRTFREKDIPCDVIWMDIDYMDGFRCFTFDPVCHCLIDLQQRPLHFTSCMNHLQ